jgi:hypothetical protein
MICPTFLDLVTGEITPASAFPMDGDVFWWTEGNGSCDCNRAIVCGKEDEMDAAMRAKHPELKNWQRYCFGCKRFVAADVAGDFEGMTKDELLTALNSEYPKHNGGCSNQNVLDPAGAYVGVAECGCAS